MVDRTNTVSEQAAELRKIAGWQEDRNAYVQKVLLQAADTLEDLSAKLAKQSSLVEKMAEEIENCYGRETELTEEARLVL